MMASIKILSPDLKGSDVKIYEERIAPNARRVRMFLAEKGLTDIEFVQVDLKAGDNISAEFKLKNPLAKIPVLELANGEYLSESMAICRYFEVTNPEKPLMGVSAFEQATIEMWQRRCELYFMNAIGMGFQHTTGYFADRMQPVKEWGEVCVKNAEQFMALLNDHLASSTFIAGEEFSVADITAFVSIDFARVIRLRMPQQYAHLNRWYALINSRESATA